jgi:hypothetical protein
MDAVRVITTYTISVVKRDDPEGTGLGRTNGGIRQAIVLKSFYRRLCDMRGTVGDLASSRRLSACGKIVY